MSESQSKAESAPIKGNQNTYTLLFMVCLSVVCALTLSILASLLAGPKEVAKELDRNKQMMIAAKLLDYSGYFLVKDESGKYVPAKLNKEGLLIPDSAKAPATNAEILQVYQNRIVPLLADDKGNLTTFQKANLDLNTYVNAYKKTGYYKQPYKLIYKVLPNAPATKESPLLDPAAEYVIPINGFGLWDAIYGYLALQPDGDTVIGTTWYDQKETPGLGANISEEAWQKQFVGKLIFQQSPDGKTDFKAAPLGITVVKGKVSEVYGDQPKAKSAVDGMAGATLTGNGVTEAYQYVLAGYRPFLIALHDAYLKGQKQKSDK